jgi:hypothetical protein
VRRFICCFGGADNRATIIPAAVATGGVNNSASGVYSSVVGGLRNEATNTAAVAVGGVSNVPVANTLCVSAAQKMGPTILPRLLLAVSTTYQWCVFFSGRRLA